MSATVIRPIIEFAFTLFQKNTYYKYLLITYFYVVPSSYYYNALNFSCVVYT